TAAKYNMCVEPNGDVIPCQSYYQSLGNILTDPWESIWQHQLSQDLRDRTWLPAKCEGCEDVAICGGGCPLYVNEGEYLCVESQSTAP
nr:SPASM domain-containing protein [Anaerolineae bacterium]